MPHWPCCHSLLKTLATVKIMRKSSEFVAISQATECYQSLIRPPPLHSAPKYISNGIWKSKNGLLDQKLKKIKDNLGKPRKRGGKEKVQMQISYWRSGASGTVNLTYRWWKSLTVLQYCIPHPATSQQIPHLCNPAY